jgi:hypothetical protein
MSLLLVSCGLGQILEPTFTPIPTTTPTETPIPGGILSGRVYLLDRDEPVRTTVTLTRGFAGEVVDSAETDENGHYSFLIDEPGAYSISVSVMDLLEICDNLRTASGGWIQTALYDTEGVADIRATSMLPISITIGVEVTLDCELNCD